ncbi:hypothetical protein ACVBEH_30860, partial [Roseateles sp. GG27B]
NPHLVAEIGAQGYSRDPKDDPFIHAAIAAGVSRLVPGDDDLLCLHPLNLLHILSTRATLNELAQPTVDSP